MNLYPLEHQWSNFNAILNRSSCLEYYFVSFPDFFSVFFCAVCILFLRVLYLGTYMFLLNSILCASIKKGGRVGHDGRQDPPECEIQDENENYSRGSVWALWHMASPMKTDNIAAAAAAVACRQRRGDHAYAAAGSLTSRLQAPLSKC